MLNQDLRAFSVEIIHSADVSFNFGSCLFENKFHFINYPWLYHLSIYLLLYFFVAGNVRYPFPIEASVKNCGKSTLIYTRCKNISVESFLYMNRAFQLIDPDMNQWKTALLDISIQFSNPFWKWNWI
jgi:hypothetical protein